MQKVGIVGGIGPASTLDYYREIIAGYRMATGARDYPKIVIDSVNMTEMLSFIDGGDSAGLIDFLLASIDRLSRAGADFAVIASNTPHFVFDRVRERSVIPLISIVEATRARAAFLGLKNLLLIGTASTMSKHFYQDAFVERGISSFVPSEEGRILVHGIIFPELEEGIVRPEKKRELVALCERLIRESGADGIVLGCTELPLMLGAGDFGVAVLDTTRIHINAIVERLVAGKTEGRGGMEESRSAAADSCMGESD
ncbi:MAG TPA: amino acid racemase [Rectinemataceae bacterium]|nr:amino acid racemase [Rectinemataceae bacterium]